MEGLVLLTMGNMEIYPLSESAATVRFGSELSETHREEIFKLKSALEEEPFPGMIECVPALTTLTIYYNPIEVTRAEPFSSPIAPFLLVKKRLLAYVENMASYKQPDYKEVRIPVVYGGEFGPDLAEAADYCGLTQEEIIQRHTCPEYIVHMIGFAPGFPYLGGMDESIAVPRKAAPRPKVPAGSVGIAGKQTGVYTLDSPGGWNIIGRTPLPLFQPNSQPPTLLKAGMRIRFHSIAEEDWEKYRSHS